MKILRNFLLSLTLILILISFNPASAEESNWFIITGEMGGDFTGHNWTETTAWQSDSAIVNGLSDIGDWSTPHSFYMDDTRYLLVGEADGVFNGYEWDGSTWNVDATIASGLGDIGTLSAPAVFYMEGTWFLISGDINGDFHGFSWIGSTWHPSGITSGLSSVVSHSKLTAFYMNSTWYIITADGDGIFYGYRWTGSTWQSYSAIASGISGVGIHPVPNVFEKDGDWYLICGNTDGDFNGFKWSGSAWESDAAIISVLGDIGSRSALTVFNTFINTAPVTSELKIEGVVNNFEIPSGTTSPTFSWTYTDIDANTQASYEIRVGTSLGISDMWASGQLSGADTSDTYAGLGLSDNTAYYLQVRTYDGTDWSAWETGIFIIGISAAAPPSVVAPVTVSQQAPLPSEPTSEPVPSKTIIEEIVSHISEPFNWILVLFAYLGAFLGKSITTSSDETLKDIIIDTALLGTIGWILILVINLFIPLIAINEFFAVFIFAVAGFALSILRNAGD